MAYPPTVGARVDNMLSDTMPNSQPPLPQPQLEPMGITFDQ
ncbi:hypothetical protein [uncultured Nostoc sp.]